MTIDTVEIDPPQIEENTQPTAQEYLLEVRKYPQLSEALKQIDGISNLHTDGLEELKLKLEQQVVLARTKLEVAILYGDLETTLSSLQPQDVQLDKTPANKHKKNFDTFTKTVVAYGLIVEQVMSKLPDHFFTQKPADINSNNLQDEISEYKKRQLENNLTNYYNYLISNPLSPLPKPSKNQQPLPQVIKQIFKLEKPSPQPPTNRQRTPLKAA